jgi:predicted RNase H-like nuclease
VTVAGCDGCRGGWIVATRDGARFVERLSTVASSFAIVGVDMPIGLPTGGPRAADVLARRRLPGRTSTVFPAPPRVLLACQTYAEANAVARQHFGKGISRQAWNLVPKIREVDALVTPENEQQWAEIHPECSFASLARTVLPPKRTAAGRAARLEVLQQEFGSLPAAVTGSAVHDVLDAFAVLWSAERFARGEHETLGDGTRDDRGLLMRIVV